MSALRRKQTTINNNDYSYNAYVAIHAHFVSTKMRWRWSTEKKGPERNKTKLKFFGRHCCFHLWKKSVFELRSWFEHGPVKVSCKTGGPEFHVSPFWGSLPKRVCGYKWRWWRRIKLGGVGTVRSLIEMRMILDVDDCFSILECGEGAREW